MQQSKWYGEQKNYSPNELNFIVKAYANCKDMQESGQCHPGKDCLFCKWGAAIQAYKDIDPFTQSRVQDKAEQLEVLVAGASAYTKYERESSIRAWIGIGIFILGIIMLFMICSFYTPPEEVFPKPNVSKDYIPAVGAAMKHLDKYLIDYDTNGKINCIDYSLAFYLSWYASCPSPNQTCYLVHNKSPLSGMDHVFVCYWTGLKWQCVEPQAYRTKNYSMEAAWGDEYSSKFNDYARTEYFIGQIAPQYNATKIYMWDKLEGAK